MRAVAEHPHTTADTITEAVRTDLGTISRQAVYDTLALLVDKALIRRIQPAGSAARYEDRVGDNHHHLVCRVCSTMYDVDCAVGGVPCLTASDDHGFTIDEAEVTYWGLCPDCQTDPGRQSGPARRDDAATHAAPHPDPHADAVPSDATVASGRSTATTT